MKPNATDIDKLTEEIGWEVVRSSEIKALREENGALQAKIDLLMLEYCPDEMTPEQMAEWERNQVRASPEQEAALAAIAPRRSAGKSSAQLQRSEEYWNP